MNLRMGSTETIGERLKRLRLARGMSQRELASPGVSYAYISRIEAGTRQPSVKALRRLAAKLGITAEYLETGSHPRPGEGRELLLSDLPPPRPPGGSPGRRGPPGSLLGGAPRARGPPACLPPPG